MECQFPCFRQKFWGASAWHNPEFEPDPAPPSLVMFSEQSVRWSKFDRSGRNASDFSTSLPIQVPVDQWKKPEKLKAQLSLNSALGKRPQFQLPDLDLENVSPQDGPESETEMRRRKQEQFENDCSQVAPGVFVAGEAVAKNHNILRSHNITHIINCVGFVYQEYFKDEIDYLTLYLLDDPEEDLMCVLYTCFDFIEDAKKRNGNILIHCSQGVSRSVAIAIMYIMWKWGQPYRSTFDEVKQRRGVSRPNIGFEYTMTIWEKKLKGLTRQELQIRRIAPHIQEDPLRLVPKSLHPLRSVSNAKSKAPVALDPRFVYVFQINGRVYVWEGQLGHKEFTIAAFQYVDQICQYEKLETKPVLVKQGQESRVLLQLLNKHNVGTNENGVIFQEQDAYSIELEWFEAARKARTSQKQQKQLQQQQQTFNNSVHALQTKEGENEVGTNSNQVSTPRRAEVEISRLDDRHRQHKHARSTTPAAQPRKMKTAGGRFRQFVQNLRR